MKKILAFVLLLLPIFGISQKKILDHNDNDLWSTVEDEAIAPDGAHVLYSLEKGEKDHFFKVQDVKGNYLLEYDRGQKGRFTHNSDYVIFTIKPWKDSIIALKKRKVKKEKLPKDSLGIFNLKTKSLTKIGDIKSYKLPEKWSGYLAYQLEEIKKEKKKEEKDSVTGSKKKKEEEEEVQKSWKKKWLSFGGQEHRKQSTRHNKICNRLYLCQKRKMVGVYIYWRDKGQ